MDFAYTVTIGPAQFGVSILWWILVTAVATYVLQRSAVGNWIFAVGGDQHAARAVGVPVTRVKIGLFMTTATAGWFVGNMILIRLDAVQATTGFGQELIYVVAAVIGGCLLNGGYGSAIGASIGALIFGMAQLGIVYLRWRRHILRAVGAVSTRYARSSDRCRVRKLRETPVARDQCSHRPGGGSSRCARGRRAIGPRGLYQVETWVPIARIA